MKAYPNQWFSRGRGCRIGIVCAWLQHTPPRKGAYVAMERAGGLFCYRGFGRFRVKPGMRARRARNDGMRSALRQAQGPTKRPRRQSAAHRYPFEDASRAAYVRHRPISALGAPQPWAQRTERAFLCGCLAERRADVTTGFLAPIAAHRPYLSSITPQSTIAQRASRCAGRRFW